MGNSAVFSVSDPADLVEVVPQLLGFVPSDSIVAIMTCGGRVTVTMRSDVADGVELAAEGVLRAALRTECDAAHLIGFGPSEVGVDVVRLARLLTPLIEVGVVLLALPNGTWRHAQGCSCCPAEGRPLSGVSAAAMGLRVASGNAPAQSRAAFEARLDPTPRAARLAALVAPVEVEAESDLLGAAAAVLLGGEPVDALPDEVVARAARALGALPMRDALLCGLCPQVMPLSEFGPLGAAVAAALPVDWAPGSRHRADRARDRFVQFCAALPQESAGEPLAVLAMFSWWCGDGALAWVATDRALAASPGCSLAQLTCRLLAEAVPPPR